MKRKIIMALAAAILATGAAMAKEIKTLTVSPQPKMHCAGCENRIKGFLKFEKGVKKIETSVDDQIVTITYDADKTTEKALLDVFTKNKYTVKKVAAPAKKK
ncbi:MAG: heavy-metal-associated domain-containing protein [Pseudoflavonifractor sp.]|nr:heavy-metal-associated domain-containing protein [Alloprevotella sp.]MCM1117649.1 heavy-metal-associated domain-containing protein [Pseudoflavonifractor sp.]